MTSTPTQTADRLARAHPSPAPVRSGHRRARSAWEAATGLVGVAVGLAPHLLHHVGLLAGTALVAGTGGTALFGAVGVIAAVPMLRRLYRRFGSWRAPAVGAVVFTAMFVLSAFVIGPAISGTADRGSPSAPTVNHQDHH